MYKFIEKYILKKEVTDNFNLFVNLPELIQNFLNGGLISLNKACKCYVLREKVFNKIKIDGKWEILLSGEDIIEENFIYYINQYPQIKEIYKKNGNIHILCDFSVLFIDVYYGNRQILITNIIDMAYVAKSIPLKTLRVFSTTNDLSIYAKKAELTPLATKEYVDTELAANVTAEEVKITNIATQLGQQLIQATDAEALVNQAISAEVSNLAGVIDTKYSELRGDVTGVQTAITGINQDLTAIESTLDSTVEAVNHVQDHLAV